jgi:transposase
VVERQVNGLDRQALDELYRGSGSSPFDPLVLLKMVLYQILKGLRSPAKWFEEAKLNEAMQWLGRGYVPARRTWYDFRDRVGDGILRLHEQTIKKAMEQELLDPEVGVQDGTSVAACASRHQMVNLETLERRWKLLQGLMDQTQQPPAPLPNWVPRTDSGRQNLAKRMQTAREILNERIEQNAARPSGKRKDPSKIQVSLTDPIAPLGRDKMKVFRPLYTVQYVVEPISRLILSFSCDPVVTDTGTLIPMIDKTQQLIDGRLKTMLADAAYCSILDLRDCIERGVELLAPVQANAFTEGKQQAKPNQQIPRSEFRFDAEENCYWCPSGHKLSYVARERKKRHGERTLWEYHYRSNPDDCVGCPLAESCFRSSASRRTIKRLEGTELLDAQREKMSDPEVKARYAIRGQTVELGFADAKGHRGLERFHGRGPRRASTETAMLVLAQNLLRLDRLQRDSLNPEQIIT